MTTACSPPPRDQIIDAVRSLTPRTGAGQCGASGSGPRHRARARRRPAGAWPPRIRIDYPISGWYGRWEQVRVRSSTDSVEYRAKPMMAIVYTHLTDLTTRRPSTSRPRSEWSDRSPNRRVASGRPIGRTGSGPSAVTHQGRDRPKEWSPRSKPASASSAMPNKVIPAPCSCQESRYRLTMKPPSMMGRWA